MLTLFFLAACAGNIVADEVRVIDGDTLAVTANEQRYHVRLAEIDAPEKTQAFGTEAANALASKLAGRTVTLRQTGTDRYGRAIATVCVGDRNINAELVSEGFAWVYARYSQNAALLREQVAAQTRRVGLWQGDAPQEPWIYRRKRIHR